MFGVDLEDSQSSLKVRQTELYFSINTTWSHQGRVQGVGSVGCHENFDVSSGFETVHLVYDLEHSSLDLVVSSCSVVLSGSSNSIDFIEKDDTCLFGSSHLEDFPNHSRTLTNVLLDKLRSNDSDKAGISSVGNSSGSQSLSRSRRTVKHDTFWRVDT